jgi:hypothetical protein
MKFVERVVRRVEGRTVGPTAMYIAAAVVIICVTLWAAALLFGYLADDRSSPPASEQSVPAAKTY